MPDPIVNSTIAQNAVAVSAAAFNPSAFWSMLTLVFNIVLSMFNILWFHIKRSNKRKYELEFTFYELLVINSSKDLIGLLSKMKKELNSLALKARGGIKAGFSRKDVEEHIEHLDQFIFELQVNTIPLIKGYSMDLGSKIDKLVEDCHDQTTDLFSKFDRQTIPVDLENRLYGSFSVLETQYLERIFKNIKEYCPHC
ncbi:MAG: hypothetical protein PHP73_01185 [Candidatus Omnitrophica bacterium]|nr:hypothetical protein [Candidatus Omnitrophota bacterium]